MKKAKYEAELKKLQIELVNVQDWVKETGQRVVIVFEGRDAAGKGGVIKAWQQAWNSCNPISFRVFPFGTKFATTFRMLP